MTRLILRRLLALPALLVATSLLTFLLLEAAPGSFFLRLSEDPAFPPELIQALEARYGLDQGVFVRYGRWLVAALSGDFGPSLTYGVSTTSLIVERLSNTLLLTGVALVIAWGLAVALGITGAVTRGRWPDRLVSVVTFGGMSTPRVLLALLLLWFAATSGVLPTGGMRDLVRWDRMSTGQRWADLAAHVALPALAVALPAGARIARQLRATLIEALGQPAILAARARGLSGPRVVLGHALSWAANPMITLLGYSVGGLLAGSFLVEVVFAWPGMARLTVEAVLTGDEPMVLASVVLATTMLTLGNLVADLWLVARDPRQGRAPEASS